MQPKRVTPTGNGFNNIRRININAAPMSIENLRKLWRAGIGTYSGVPGNLPSGTLCRVASGHTIKGNFRWRLYAMHRAMDAGIDDVAIGALFGLYDWRFEVMGWSSCSRPGKTVRYRTAHHFLSAYAACFGIVCERKFALFGQGRCFPPIGDGVASGRALYRLVVTARSVLNYGVKLSIMVAHRRMLLRKSVSEPIPRKRYRKKIPIRFSLCWATNAVWTK